MDGDSDANGVLDDLDLLQHSVDQFGAIAGTDEELLCSCTDDAALDLELRTLLVLLRIDYPDAGRRDSEMIDVGPRPRDSTVVQDAHSVASQFGEPATETLLAHRTDVPGKGALRVIAESEDEPTELRVLGPYPVMPCTLTPFELAACRSARCPRVNNSQLARRLSWRVRDSHRGRLGCWFQCRLSRLLRAMQHTTDRLH